MKRGLAALAVAAPVSFALGLASVPRPALAHDCSGPDDCAVLPPNVDKATGIAGGAAGGAAGWVYLRRRLRNKNKKPCDELRQQVEQGEARIKDLQAKIAATQKELDALPKDAPDKPVGNPRDPLV
jgi:hypothetical protein